MFKPFGRQCVHPGVYREGLYLGDDAIARGISVFGKEFGIVLRNVRRNAHHQLRQGGAVFCSDGTVLAFHHVEHHVVVGGVAVVAVPVPVGCQTVDFYIPHPVCFANADLCVEEVGSSVQVVQSRIDDFDGSSVCGMQLSGRKDAMLPYVMQEFFHVIFHHGARVLGDVFRRNLPIKMGKCMFFFWNCKDSP